MSFVWGEENVAYLRKRYEALKDAPALRGPRVQRGRRGHPRPGRPLLIPGRKPTQPIAATRIAAGTDVDFGALTRMLLDELLDERRRAQARAPGHRSQAQQGRHLAHQAAARGRRHAARRQRAVRLRRRRRRRAHAAAAVGHHGDPGLRRLPGQRPVPAHRRPRAWSRSHAAKVYGKAAVGFARRCRCRTSTPASSTASRACCSARTPGSRPSSSRPARTSTCSRRSAGTTSAR